MDKSRGGMPNPTAKVEPLLDHVVINTLDQLDEAAEQYRRLGFALTQRGHHTLGSSNHLAIFESNYLELLGVLLGRESNRPDVWAHPRGLSGLVFKGTDPALTHAAMLERGVPMAEPMQFSRPVDLPGGAQDARFSVVRVTGDAIQNGRSFFCHHFTPELVWRSEWQDHPNAVTGIAEFLIAARDPARAAAIYERMFGPGLLTQGRGGVSFRAGAATVLIVDPATAAERTGGAAPTTADGSDRMVALKFKTRSLATVRSVLQAGGVPFVQGADGGIVVPYRHASEVALVFAE
jgi:Glyoxalase-like domain